MAQRVSDEEEEFLRLQRRAVGPEPKARRRSHVRFVQVPLSWAARAAKATQTPRAMVWLWLLYTSWDRGSRTVLLANTTLRGWGVSRRTKWRVLQDLEKAGLILIERRPRKSPRITIA